METIDITPTWQAALMIYLAAWENGTPRGRQAAREGLEQMANVAQAHVEMIAKLKAAGINPDEI